jgi:hypothetical protein
MRGRSPHARAVGRAVVALMVSTSLLGASGCGGSDEGGTDTAGPEVHLPNGRSKPGTGPVGVPGPPARPISHRPKAVVVPRRRGKECGDLATSGAGTKHVIAGGVDCGTARAVARAWEPKCAGSLPGRCTASEGFECTARAVSHELATVFCEDREHRVVSFEYGA